MVTIEYGTPAAIQTALSTGLNSLANGAFSAVSADIDNETGLYLYMEAELVLASLTPTASPYCALYIVSSIDAGTNFEDVPNTASIPAAIFQFTTATAAKRQVKYGILVPPMHFKLSLGNNMGPALAASGNTVRYRLYSELAS